MREERIDEIFEALPKYTIDLVSDPTTLGPVYILNTIAKARNYLNIVAQMVLEVERDKRVKQRRLRALRAQYAQSEEDLLAHDSEVKKQPSIEDRKAYVATLLRELRGEISELELDLESIADVERVVKFRHKELRDTISELRLQQKAIHDDLGLRGFYGDERTPAEADSSVPALPMSDEEIAKVLDGEDLDQEPQVYAPPPEDLEEDVVLEGDDFPSDEEIVEEPVVSEKSSGDDEIVEEDFPSDDEIVEEDVALSVVDSGIVPEEANTEPEKDPRQDLIPSEKSDAEIKDILDNL